jgi:CBS domain-containing protein
MIKLKTINFINSRYRDILRLSTYKFERTLMTHLKVKNIIDRRPLLKVSLNTPVSEVMQDMVAKRMTAVCVVRRDKLVGIFTMKDVMTKVFGYQTSSIWKRPKKRKIKDVPVRLLMSSDPHVIDASRTVFEAADLMQNHKIRHLPVMDGEELLGVATLRDVIQGVRESDQKDEALKQRTKPLHSMYADDFYHELLPVTERR